MFKIPFLVFFAIFYISCSDLDINKIQCSTTNPCPSGATCVTNHCVADTPECTTNADCTDTAKPICNNGTCIADSGNNCNGVDCEEGGTCESLEGNRYKCNCGNGYHHKDNNETSPCVANTTDDCNSITCGDNEHCDVNNPPQCICNNNYKRRQDNGPCAQICDTKSDCNNPGEYCIKISDTPGDNVCSICQVGYHQISDTDTTCVINGKNDGNSCKSWNINKTRCSEDGIATETCNGSNWVRDSNCPNNTNCLVDNNNDAGEGICDNGTCTAQTCTGLSRECGSTDDGCGNTLDCGTCGSGMNCNAMGQCVDNQQTCYSNTDCTYDTNLPKCNTITHKCMPNDLKECENKADCGASHFLCIESICSCEYGYNNIDNPNICIFDQNCDTQNLATRCSNDYKKIEKCSNNIWSEDEDCIANNSVCVINNDNVTTSCQPNQPMDCPPHSNLIDDGAGVTECQCVTGYKTDNNEPPTDTNYCIPDNITTCTNNDKRCSNDYGGFQTCTNPTWSTTISCNDNNDIPECNENTCDEFNIICQNSGGELFISNTGGEDGKQTVPECFCDNATNGNTVNDGPKCTAPSNPSPCATSICGPPDIATCREQAGNDNGNNYDHICICKAGYVRENENVDSPCVDNTTPECTANTDCTNVEAPICDTSTHTCIPCQINNDCSIFPETPICNVNSYPHTCVECTTNNDCNALGSHSLCNDNKCVCDTANDYTLINGECRKLGIFVTQGEFAGDLGGTLEADDKCNADNNKPDNRHYKALIGSNKRNIDSNWPLWKNSSYFRANNKNIKIGETNENAIFPLNNNELFEQSISDNETIVWTGLTSTFTNNNNNCLNWKSSINSNSGAVGTANKASYKAILGTTGSPLAICNEVHNLYCVEQVCPEGYTGDTCSNCDEGYRLIDNGCFRKCGVDNGVEYTCDPNSEKKECFMEISQVYGYCVECINNSDCTNNLKPYCNDRMCVPQKAFITEWETTADNDSIEIKDFTGYAYDYSIDCDNDGTFEATDITGSHICSYPNSGIHKIAIKGVFEYFQVADNDDVNKLKKVTQWGDIKWKSMGSSFLGCPNVNITATDAPDLSIVEDMRYMFDGATAFNGDISNWDVSHVTDMSYMFYNAKNFNQDIGSWDVSNVTDMSYMFHLASNFSQNLSNWNVTNVTNMQGMFNQATAFNGNVTNWHVDNVTDMSFMFYGADNFNKDIGSWQPNGNTNISHMFQGASSFNQNLSSWHLCNTENLHTNYDSGASIWYGTYKPEFKNTYCQ